LPYDNNIDNNPDSDPASELGVWPPPPERPTQAQPKARKRPYLFGGPRSGPGRDLLASFLASIVINVILLEVLLIGLTGIAEKITGRHDVYYNLPEPIPYCAWAVTLALSLTLTWWLRRFLFIMQAFLVWTAIFSLLSLYGIWLGPPKLK